MLEAHDGVRLTCCVAMALALMSVAAAACATAPSGESGNSGQDVATADGAADSAGESREASADVGSATEGPGTVPPGSADGLIPRSGGGDGYAGDRPDDAVSGDSLAGGDDGADSADIGGAAAGVDSAPAYGLHSDSDVPITVVQCPDLENLRHPEENGLECALATLPIDRSDLSLGATEISFALWPASGGAAGTGGAAPLAVLQGGPGGASSDLVGYYPRKPYPQIFIDQRGTGFGSADFDCPETDAVLEEVLGATTAQAEIIQLDSYAQCSDRLSEHPMFAHTNTASHAADVADIMAALGYDRWCVYGVSYGTTIALEIMRSPPESLACAVLDGVFPPDLDYETDIALSAGRALDELDYVCADSGSCGDAVGDLRSTVGDLVERLNAEPLEVLLDSGDTSLRKSVDVLIDGDALAGLLFLSMYDYEIALSMAFMVDSLDAGMDFFDRDLARLAVEYQVFLSKQNYEGTYFAATCADRLPFTSGVPDDLDVFEAAVMGDGLGKVCAFWDVPASSAAAASPVTSDLPVLLLSGQFDPITPAEHAERVAQNLSNAVLVERVGRGHGVWSTDECVDGIVEEFLARPSEKPDIACAGEPPSPWNPFS